MRQHSSVRMSVRPFVGSSVGPRSFRRSVVSQLFLKDENWGFWKGSCESFESAWNLICIRVCDHLCNSSLNLNFDSFLHTPLHCFLFLSICLLRFGLDCKLTFVHVFNHSFTLTYIHTVQSFSGNHIRLSLFLPFYAKKAFLPPFVHLSVFCLFFFVKRKKEGESNMISGKKLYSMNVS